MICITAFDSLTVNHKYFEGQQCSAVRKCTVQRSPNTVALGGTAGGRGLLRTNGEININYNSDLIIIN